jgi:4-oxalocrotonate tautomerase family enzyme
MPHIQITFTKGRTTEQKRRLAQRLVDVLAEEAQAAPRNISVSLVEVEPDCFFSTGELALDRRKREAGS